MYAPSLRIVTPLVPLMFRPDFLASPGVCKSRCTSAKLLSDFQLTLGRYTDSFTMSLPFGRGDSLCRSNNHFMKIPALFGNLATLQVVINFSLSPAIGVIDCRLAICIFGLPLQLFDLEISYY